MRTITSMTMALALAGGLLGASFCAAAAENLSDDSYYEGQFHKSYAQPYNGSVSNTPTQYFYIDGQWQPTYEPASSSVKGATSPAPTEYFYYGNQWHPSYVNRWNAQH